MKKTLIALALTALPVASMADVILYGQVKAGVEVTKTSVKNPEWKAAGVGKGTTTQLVDYGSRIGFKGHEHLNGDLNAIWQLETSFDVAGGNGASFGDRDTFIGLQSKSFGTVKAGNLSTPVKAVNDALDVWEYSNSSAGLAAFTRETEAATRKLAVSYTTPEFAGVTATAYVSPSENGTEDSAFRSEADYATYGLGFSYNNAGIFADLAGTYVKGSSLSGVNNKKGGYQYVAQAGYDANNWLLGVAYQQARDVDVSAENGMISATRIQEVAVTGTYNVTESLRAKASAAYGFNAKDAEGNKAYGNGKYQQAIIGADYALSKRTQLNAQVGHLRSGKSDDRFAETTGSFGLKHKF